MERRKSPYFLFFVLVAFCLLAGPTNSVFAVAQYTLTKLDVPGSEFSVACDINDAGQIVGDVESQDGRWHAFMWDNGKIEELGFIDESAGIWCHINNAGTMAVVYENINDHIPGSYLYSEGTLSAFKPDVYIERINTLGSYVGTYITGTRSHAFFQKGDVFYDLGTLSSADLSDSEAHDINDFDQIVGGSIDYTTNTIHAFLWEKGQMKDLGGDCSMALGINSSGQIVGNSIVSPGHSNGILWQNGKMTVLDVEDAWDINNVGQILCGSGSLKDGESNFLYEAGNYYALDDLVLNLDGWSMLDGYSINDLGQIVGSGYIDGEEQAFLMTPVPEPGIWVLLTVGGMLAGRRK